MFRRTGGLGLTAQTAWKKTTRKITSILRWETCRQGEWLESIQLLTPTSTDLANVVESRLLSGMGVTPLATLISSLLLGTKINDSESSTNNQNKQNTSLSNRKVLIEQMLHKDSLINRQRSSSFSEYPLLKQQTVDSQDKIGNIDTNKDIEFQENSEGNWTEVKRERQRNSPEMTRHLKQTKLNNYWLSQPVSTSNSFASLEEEDQQETNTDLNEKTTKLPPIFIDKVSNMQPLIKLLNDHANGNYETKVLRNEQVKILLKTSEVYTTIVKQLELKNTEFYTYKPKQERNFKVVLKNMHPSTDTDEIKKALDELGHTVTNIWNIKQRRTEKTLPMFIVELQSKANNKHIYEIKSLMDCRIIFATTI